MTARTSSNPERIRVDDPVAAALRYDYADSFRFRLPAPSTQTPEEWLRAGFGSTPAWIKRVAGHAKGMRPFHVVQSEPSVVVLRDSDSLMTTTLVGRNDADGSRVLTTILSFKRPLVARLVWAIVGILHRRTAPKVIMGGVASAGPA